MKKETLSDKMKGMCYLPKLGEFMLTVPDVREFIQNVLDELQFNEPYGQSTIWIDDIVKKLAGSELIHSQTLGEQNGHSLGTSSDSDTNDKKWKCLICKEEVNDNEMCKCMRTEKKKGCGKTWYNSKENKMCECRIDGLCEECSKKGVEDD